MVPWKNVISACCHSTIISVSSGDACEFYVAVWAVGSGENHNGD